MRRRLRDKPEPLFYTMPTLVPHNPLVSVLLPVYNASAAAATAAIASVLDQTLPDWELILVDDGSAPPGRKLLEQQARRDPRIRLLRQAHAGIVQALNLGLAHCRAPLIARLDADDLSLPQRLELQSQFLQAHPAIGLVGCRVAFGGDRNAQAGYAAYVDWTNSILTPAQIAQQRFVESPFAHPSVMFRAQLPHCYGAYRDGAFPEDYELWLRWLEQGVAMAKLPDVLLVWSDPPGRLSRTDGRYAPEAFYACKAQYLARWLAQHNPGHPQILIWGAGRTSRRRAELLCAAGIKITAYVDIDPRKIGQRIGDRPVLAPAQLPPPGQAFVVSYVGSRGARELIEAQLCERGYRPGLDYILAA